MAKFKNISEEVFSDIWSEEYREYVFPNNQIVRIDRPLFLSVSNSGGHRVYSMDGISHYIPSGWIHLRWKAAKGQPNFVR